MNLVSRFVQFNEKQSLLTTGEILVPALKNEEILIKVKYTSLCRSDINTFIGKRSEKTPTILGHEIVGEIVAFGTDTLKIDIRSNPLVVGDIITWGIFASDPEDRLSKLGLPQKATDLFKYGHETITEQSHLHGGLADYIILRKNTPLIKFLIPLPFEVCSIINCSVATVAASLRLAENLTSKSVLIIGAGMLGIIGVAMLQKHQVASITVVDISETRLNKAKKFGATETYLFEEFDLNLDFYDVVIDYSGIHEAINLGMKKLNVGGMAIWVGATFPQKSLLINPEEVIRKILTIKGIHNYNVGDLITAVQFIEQYNQKYKFEELIEQSFDIENIQSAFEYAVENNPYRVGISFN